MLEILKASKITPLSNFDPMDPKHLADPTLDTLDATARARFASELHAERLLRGLKFMRPHVAPAVARQYLANAWIFEDQVPAFRSRDHPAAAFQNPDGDSDHDEAMSQDSGNEL
jgi:hypothetical protein